MHAIILPPSVKNQSHVGGDLESHLGKVVGKPHGHQHRWFKETEQPYPPSAVWHMPIELRLHQLFSTAPARTAASVGLWKLRA